MFGIPMVVKHGKTGERAYDIFSRLLEDRIIFLADEITPESAALTIAQLLHLNSESNEDIALYVMSPGGHVDAGLAIIDTMNYIKSDVMTIGLGTCASMGALILSSGQKGKRVVLPDTRVMIHQVLGGAQGQATDIEIQTKEILRLKKRTNQILAANTGKTLKTIEKDTERDNYLSAEEAVKYGLIDGIIRSMNEVEAAVKKAKAKGSNMNEELELKIKRYMFFKHVDELQYQERYSKIETMILEEFQKLDIDNDHSIAFVDDGGLGEVGCKLASYDDERKLFAFLPKNIDLIWEIKSDAVKRLNPGCNSLRSFIRINVLHEYRHYQQCKFAESMGIKSTDMGEVFSGVPHNENLMEIDARNYALGNASDADLLKLVEAYYKLK